MSDYKLLQVVMVGTTSGEQWEVRYLGKARSFWERHDRMGAGRGPRVRIIVSDGVRSAIAEAGPSGR